MPKDSIEYGPLLVAEDECEKGDRHHQDHHAIPAKKKDAFPSRRTLSFIVIGETIVLLLGLFLSFDNNYKVDKHLPGRKQLFSPAQDVIEYEVKTFHVGFEGDMTVYQGEPSKELDEAWEDLYNFGISRIPKSQAAQLANKTSAIPDDPGYYIVELDVFHQLHCLNMIRKALNPLGYPDMSLTNPDPQEAKDNKEHISHCIDSIRQSLMCAGDVSTIVWQWAEPLKKAIVRGDVAHTCRNFEKIREWGKESTMRTLHDDTKKIEDGIVIPIIHN
ncbi:hypothetical protein BDQ12DRAFT_112969 [Crucibulum laeve]|uniref:Tat pathway signal sequence n=1 Tax=Crucibulum laeve TaxID=68775 RepID=A0A5C3MBB7_9AGAR|nr:hypothetical protein BDQ12DRAFT_112969 [Crucibulum laeve]